MKKRCKDCGSELEKNFCHKCDEDKSEAVVDIEDIAYLQIHRNRANESVANTAGMLLYSRKNIIIGFILSGIISAILIYLMLAKEIQFLSEASTWLFGALITAGLYLFVVFFRLGRAITKAIGEMEKESEK
jgi:hypothetical protein